MGVASVGSTLNDSAIHDCATSTDSRSSSVRVPSVREVLRKSIIESARRCLVVAMLERKAALIEGRIDSRDSRPTNSIVGNCVGGVEAVVMRDTNGTGMR